MYNFIVKNVFAQLTFSIVVLNILFLTVEQTIEVKNQIQWLNFTLAIFAVLRLKQQNDTLILMYLIMSILCAIFAIYSLNINHTGILYLIAIFCITITSVIIHMDEPELLK